MQLCALNSHNELVFAARAVRQHDYFCLECGQHIRLRKGIHRQPHYYHTQANRTCRQAGKGMAHLLAQHYIKSLLPEGEAHLEYRFSQIGRIADVVWIPRRIVYEIQYSPIAASEIKERNADYATLGYQVVWILHDGRYNRKKITSAEDFLFSCPHYFTDIDETGKGSIYDQCALMQYGEKYFPFPRLKVDLSNPQFINNNFLNDFEVLPQLLLQRALRWKMYFSGDYIASWFSKTPIDSSLALAISTMNDYEKKTSEKPIWEYIKDLFYRFFVAPYRAVLRLLLERACR